MRVLITVPLLTQPGGVANYYRVLQLNRLPGVEYLEVTAEPRSGAQLVWRLLRVYAVFLRRVFAVDTVMLNPSMARRSLLRDAVFAFLTVAAGRRLVVFWRGWDWRFFQAEVVGTRAMRWLFRRTFSRAHTMISLGTEFETGLRKLAPSARCTYVRETTVADDSRLDWSAQELLRQRMSAEQHTLLFMSRLEPRKGLFEALKAYAMVRASRSDVNLIVAGDGPELEAATAMVGRDRIPGVTFVGYVEGNAKHETLLQSTLLLFPTSYGEGLPNTLLEAMLYGMPVVTTNVGGISEVVVDGVNGRLASSDDPYELAQLVLGILENRELRQSMITENLAVARERFASAKVAARMAGLLTGSSWVGP